jgi:hypothetical protein
MKTTQAERARPTKFNVNFSAATHEDLSDLSAVLAAPMAEVIREALGLLKWLVRESLAGNKLLIQRGDRITEVAFPVLERLSDRERSLGRGDLGRSRGQKPERLERAAATAGQPNG